MSDLYLTTLGKTNRNGIEGQGNQGLIQPTRPEVERSWDTLGNNF